MYTVTIYNGIEDTEGTLIHSPYVDDIKCVFNINQLLRSVSNMDLTINMQSPAWGIIKPLKTLIKVVNIRTGKREFDGRILKKTEEMNSNGMHYVKYACESKLAYLNDSNQRYNVVQDTTVAGFFAQLINKHNEQVEPYKQFKVGNVTVTNSTNNVYRYVGYSKTMNELKENLIDSLGGYLMLREEADGNYIDYLAEVGDQKNTPIRLRSNLKDMRRDIDPTQIITRVIPLGKRLEATEGGTGSVSQPRLTIESVNSGIDYIDIPELQEEFGIITGEVIYDDVTTPDILLLRGQQFIASQKAARVSYDIQAINLDMIDPNFEEFELGNYHPIEQPFFGIDERLQIIEKKIASNNPQSDSLTFGEKQLTLTQYQVQANRQTKRVENLELEVTSQSETLNNLQNSVNQVTQEVNNVTQEVNDVKGTVDEADLPALTDAVDSLNQAVENLTTTVEGINLATQTEDGLMSSEDKTKLDGLENYSNATETESGLMSTTDKAKLNLITVLNSVDLDDLRSKLALIYVTQSIDLDQLEQRVSNLEGS
ncbi:phage tail spike protein [Paraliobacillus ryukyuensis]|uniref:phage tail spike protein n=1 Tax=Paraliobacillus ryukyuensis TaxID=200904 RepID=UPI0009A5C215|nr:phage tail spike protein [Paraliobacillus ryukyuensis]